MSSTLSQKVIRIIFRNNPEFIQNILSEVFFMSYLTDMMKLKERCITLFISKQVIYALVVRSRVTPDGTKNYPTDHCT